MSNIPPSIDYLDQSAPWWDRSPELCDDCDKPIYFDGQVWAHRDTGEVDCEEVIL